MDALVTPDTAMLITLFFFLGIGCLSGFMSGLLGIGSGLILVPAILFWVQHLSYGLGVDAALAQGHAMHIALATTFSIMLPTGISSMLSHHRNKNIQWDAVRLMGPYQLAGIILGTWCADALSSDSLTTIFAFGILVLSALIVRPLPNKLIRDQLPGHKVAVPVSGLIGFCSSIIGIGGATMNVPFLSFYGVDLRRAIGTASALGLLISLPAVVMYIIWGLDSGMSYPVLGYVHLLPWAVITPMGVAFAPVGARFTQTLPVQRIRYIFAIVMVVVAATLFYGAA